MWRAGEDAQWNVIEVLDGAVKGMGCLRVESNPWGSVCRRVAW